MADVVTIDQEQKRVGRALNAEEQEQLRQYNEKRAKQEKEYDDRAAQMLKEQGLTGNSSAEQMFKLQARLEKYVNADIKKEQEGKGDPGGTVLKLEIEEKEVGISEIVFSKEQKDMWSFWGWTNDTLQQVREGFEVQFLQTGLPLSLEQQKLILGLLISTGQPPNQILESLTPAFQQAKKWGEQVGQGQDQPLAIATNFLNNLGIREEYIRRFILKKEYRDKNDLEYNTQGPGNIEELAYQMAYKDQNGWGINGDFPTLELRVIADEKTKKIDAKKSRYYINQANVRRWGIRGQHHLYDIDPSAMPNYFQEVKIEKESSMYHVTLGAMFDSENTIFLSEDPDVQYWELEMQMQIDPWIMGSMRQLYRTFENDMAKDTKVAEVLGGLFYMSPLTKRTFSKNMLYYMSLLPLNFESSKKGEFTTPDHKVGSAMTDMLLSYMYISDYRELEKVLGQKSSFFTREGMQAAMDKVFSSATKTSGSADARSFIREESYKLLQDSFVKVIETDEDGKRRVVHRVVDTSKSESQKTDGEKAADKERQGNFVKLANIFTKINEDANKVEMIRQALKDAMQERYGFTVNGQLDTYTLWQAELIAHSCTNWSGIASLNDTGAAAFNALSKFIRTSQYRLKMASVERGGPAGNPTSAFLFKQLLVPFFDGFSTTSKEYSRNGYKTTHEVLKEIQQHHSAEQAVFNRLERELKKLEGEKGEGIGTPAWVAKKQQLEMAVEKYNQEYRKRAGQLSYNNDAMRDYSANHVDRASKMWEIVSGAKEIDFTKFTKHDAYGRVTLDRAAFQQEVQKNVLTHIRYMISMGDIDYSMPYRAPKVVPDPNKKYGWKTVWTDMPLGQALFGYEILDRHEFWEKDKETGRWLYDENGRHKIDYAKVQKDKITLWKNWAVMKLAADFQRHLKRSAKDRSAFDINHHHTYYLHVLETLEAIPGAIMGDEYNMAGVTVPQSFFSHHDIAILKKKSGIGTTWFWTKYFWDSVSGKGEKESGFGFGEALGIMVKNMVDLK